MLNIRNIIVLICCISNVQISQWRKSEMSHLRYRAFRLVEALCMAVLWMSSEEISRVKTLV
ncbi:hypothetical protein RLDS_18980 [Sphingobium lactosutens DS20]|uniref:Uncharacterized protein n=1 Tax=Sphingobium lactosutens DS20 TaxID=1331060 RepID=T0H992_9SPHN|nr:hypothetical protein RLDS_18980 [Sphingobium lactosutens DS20]